MTAWARDVLRGCGIGIPNDLKDRTFRFAIAVYRLCAREHFDGAARVIRAQLIDASSSAAANYRAACRGRSRPEFIAKIGIAIEEADESLFWLHFMEGAGILSPSSELQKLRTEANELVAIFTASQKTARENEERAKRDRKHRARPD